MLTEVTVFRGKAIYSKKKNKKSVRKISLFYIQIQVQLISVNHLFCAGHFHFTKFTDSLK